jgi:hypothetical protein
MYTHKLNNSVHCSVLNDKYIQYGIFDIVKQRETVIVAE